MSDVQIIKNLGVDALPNFFNVILPVISGVQALQGLEFRITTFPIPAKPKPTVYTIPYKSAKLQKTGGSFEYEFELTLPVRVDRNYFVVNYFETWINLGYNHETGIVDELLVPTGNTVVQKVDSNNIVKHTWTFEDFKPLSNEGYDLDYNTDADPIVQNILCQYSIFRSE